MKLKRSLFLSLLIGMMMLFSLSLKAEGLEASPDAFRYRLGSSGIPAADGRSERLFEHFLNVFPKYQEVSIKLSCEGGPGFTSKLTIRDEASAARGSAEAALAPGETQELVLKVQTTDFQGSAYQLRLDAENIPGYSREISGNIQTGFSVRYVYRYAEVKVHLSYEGGDGIASILVLRDAEDRYYGNAPAFLDEEKETDLVFKALVRDEKGRPYDLFLEAGLQDGYSVSVSGSLEDGYNVHYLSRYGSLPLRLNCSGGPGFESSLKLYDGEDLRSEVKLKLNGGESISALPEVLLRDEDGVLTPLTLKVSPVKDYVFKISGSSREGFTIDALYQKQTVLLELINDGKFSIEPTLSFTADGGTVKAGTLTERIPANGRKASQITLRIRDDAGNMLKLEPSFSEIPYYNVSLQGSVRDGYKLHYVSRLRDIPVTLKAEGGTGVIEDKLAFLDEKGKVRSGRGKYTPFRLEADGEEELLLSCEVIDGEGLPRLLVPDLIRDSETEDYGTLIRGSLEEGFEILYVFGAESTDYVPPTVSTTEEPKKTSSEAETSLPGSEKSETMSSEAETSLPLSEEAESENSLESLRQTSDTAETSLTGEESSENGQGGETASSLSEPEQSRNDGSETELGESETSRAPAETSESVSETAFESSSETGPEPSEEDGRATSAEGENDPSESGPGAEKPAGLWERYAGAIALILFALAGGSAGLALKKRLKK